MRPLTSATVGLGLVGGCALAYSLYEARQYTLRQLQLPALPAGASPIRVLHLTDLHITPNQHDKARWIAGLARLEPDLVVGTGDFIAHPESVPFLAEALGSLLDRPGVFVLGSNDFHGPRLKNPLRYLAGPSKGTEREIDLPWMDLVASLSSGGWLDLDNRTGELVIDDLRYSFKGVDDPHIGRDDLSAVAGPFPQNADVRVGVAHAPYLRVLDAFSRDGADVIFAGHTHGGQVCVPGYGALVTNCDLPTDKVKGVFEHDGSMVHVSAGLGTNPYTPIRFACPPEASLITLVPVDTRPSLPTSTANG